MSIKIALAGNPNSGKTTLFNALTGSNQFVGNWPGVTVEKKEGKLKSDKSVTITDLPGIYSLSPYTLEEVVARNYILDEKPDAILNIVDGTNLERNLYLTTQLLELGVPVVVAVNMMDVVKKSGSRINAKKLSEALGCSVVEISALKGSGVEEAAQLVVSAAGGEQPIVHSFSVGVEDYLSKIEAQLHVPEAQKRFYAIKLFERDDKIAQTGESLPNVEDIIKEAEDEFDDDSESIITNERYEYITSIIDSCYVNKQKGRLTVSDKIDKIVTNRFLALPIFVVVMFLVYYISWSTLGTIVTDWTNDGVFGDGWHLTGQSDYDEAMNEFAAEYVWTDDVVAAVDAAAAADVAGAGDIQGAIEDGDFAAFDEAYGSYADAFAEEGYDISATVDAALEMENVPATEDYGIYVPGIPVFVERGLDAINCADWLKSLVLDGIVGGVGAVLGFVPQMLVLFILLAVLEGCGYMARVAFIMDRIFRRFGLSGKSFIPMLIGTGCGVPGVMASRTIENDRDRKMTVMTTTFIPCGAKMPIVALIATALFHGAWWVAPSAYFIGIAAIIISGIILKKTKIFAGDPAPFVMELPAYHVPTFGSVIRSMWERGSSFIKKAGTIILLSSIFIWAGSHFGTTAAGGFGFELEMELENSVLGMIANVVKWIFLPLGFDNIKATIATVMGLVAKEEVVGVFGVLDFEGMTSIAAYSFLIFNLLCAPCFAAIGAIKREMNSAKWTWIAIGYQTIFAYCISLMVYQIVGLIMGVVSFSVWTVLALVVLAAFLYLLFRKNKYDENRLAYTDVKRRKKAKAVK